MKKLLTYLLLLLPSTMLAQGDVEYKMEIGGALGLVNYLGDYNGSIMGNQRPMASIMLKRVINPFQGLRADLSVGTIGGKYTLKDDYFTHGPMDSRKFSNTLFDLSAVYEYNFWAYGTGKDYHRAKRVAPFIFIGLGATVVNTGQKTEFTGNVPIGAGVKYKVADRLNLALEWAAHFSMSDNLDGVVDPYGIKRQGIFKNTDGYSMLKLSLTYSFMPKCSTCNPED